MSAEKAVLRVSLAGLAVLLLSLPIALLISGTPGQPPAQPEPHRRLQKRETPPHSAHDSPSPSQSRRVYDEHEHGGPSAESLDGIPDDQFVLPTIHRELTMGDGQHYTQSSLEAHLGEAGEGLADVHFTLTKDVADMAMRTWGSELSPEQVRVWSGGSSEVVTQDLCGLAGAYSWFLVVGGASARNYYINLPLLAQTMARLAAEESIHLGLPKCKKADVMLLSRMAVCEKLSTCKDSQEYGLVHLDQSQLQDYAQDLGQVFSVGPVSPTALLQLHLMFTEFRISQLQAILYHLSDQLEVSESGPAAPRPKRDSQADQDFERLVLDTHKNGLNESAEPFYEYFDDKGVIYPESCRVRKESLNESRAFMTARDMTNMHFKSKIVDFKRTESFGYKITKANSGVEYQFYVIEKRKNKHKGKDRVHQAIVELPYTNIEIAEKTFHQPEDMTIVTMADDLSTLPGTLSHLSAMCETIRPAKCSVLVLYESSMLSGDYSQLKNIIDGVQDMTPDYRPSSHISEAKEDIPAGTLSASHVRFSPLDISSSRGSNLNSFQRAFVHVQETAAQSSIIVFLHPHSHISEQFLWRCQANTRARHVQSVYFPIPFQYTSSTATSVSSTSGFWRVGDFDTFCTHMSELRELSIVPRSPRMMYQLLMGVGDRDVVRRPESTLTRAWDPTTMCVGYEDSEERCIEALRQQNL